MIKVSEPPQNLADALGAMTQKVVELEAELEATRKLLATYKAMLFGARSEKARLVLGDQASLDLGDLSEAPLTSPAANDDPVPARTQPRTRRNIGALPKHLPRVIRMIEPESTRCACCDGALHRIGEDISEALDIVPAVLRVIATVRPKYACRACDCGIIQAPAPKRMIEGGMATTSFIAWIVTQRFAWYLPIYRQTQMLAGQGLTLDRSTAVRWVQRTAWWLEGLYDRQLAFIHRQGRIHVDETRMPVIEPGRGKVDGYAAYKALEVPGRTAGAIRLAFCLAHLRRRFVDLHKSTQSPITARIIALLGRVYRIEGEIRGSSAEHRLAVRQAKAKPVMDELKALLDETLARISTASSLAEHIRYAHGHWRGLTRFLDDGRIEVDNNMIERQMRPIGIGRRNSLFAGNEGGAKSWAILASLLQTAKLNGLDPFIWLDDVLDRIVSGEVKNNALDQLLAWNWAPKANGSLLAAAA